MSKETKTDKSERRALFHRQNILTAAKELFLKKGVENTSMDEVAKISDYSKSTIYVYFHSKEDIFYHIVLEYMTILYEGIKKCILLYEDTKICYDAICDQLVKFQSSYPMYFECILGKINVEDGELEKYTVLAQIYEVGEEINTLVVSFFEQGVKSNYFDHTLNPLPTVMVLWSSMSSIISMSLKKEEYYEKRLGMNREDFLRYGFELILNTVRRKNTL